MHLGDIFRPIMYFTQVQIQLNFFQEKTIVRTIGHKDKELILVSLEHVYLS